MIRYGDKSIRRMSLHTFCVSDYIYYYYFLSISFLSGLNCIYTPHKLGILWPTQSMSFPFFFLIGRQLYWADRHTLFCVFQKMVSLCTVTYWGQNKKKISERTVSMWHQCLYKKLVLPVSQSKFIIQTDKHTPSLRRAAPPDCNLPPCW